MEKPLKSLKKRMAKSFKAMLKTLDDGQLPSWDLVASWHKDAKLMVTLLDRGKEHFRSFQSRCQELLESVQERRLEAAKAAAEALNRMRKECHSRYK